MERVELFDTQIVSYAFKGARDFPPGALGITSVTAQEFLLMQTRSPNKNAYYVPRPNLLPKDPFADYPNSPVLKRFAKEHGGFRKRDTDSLIIDLPGQLPTIVEHSHIAISDALNRRKAGTIKAALAGLPKRKRPLIQDRLEFLLDHSIRCIPLTADAVPLAINFVIEFSARHAAKANFRNTFNDIACIAVAALTRLDFHTDDRLLARFVQDLTDTKLLIQPEEVVLQFQDTAQARHSTRENRGYINRPRILREDPL